MTTHYLLLFSVGKIQRHTLLLLKSISSRLPRVKVIRKLPYNLKLQDETPQKYSSLSTAIASQQQTLITVKLVIIFKSCFDKSCTGILFCDHECCSKLLLFVVTRTWHADRRSDGKSSNLLIPLRITLNLK